MPFSAEDKEFLIRALGMHAVLSRSFGGPSDDLRKDAEFFAGLIGQAVIGSPGTADASEQSLARSCPENVVQPPQSS